MEILRSSLLLIIAFFLYSGDSSSQGESSRGLRSRFRSRSRSPLPVELELLLGPPGWQANQSVFPVRSQRDSSRSSRARTPSPLRLQLYSGQPHQPDNQSLPESNAGQNEGSRSRSPIRKFRLSGYHPPPVQGPANSFLWYKHKRIEVVLDHTGTKILRADYPGNNVPHGKIFLNSIFLCRQAEIGNLIFVEYIKEDGSLMGVRAPTLTNANVMEPNNRTSFVVHMGNYFRVKHNPQTKRAESISLIPRNLQAAGDRSREENVGGFKFIKFKKNGVVSGAALPPEGS